MLILCQSFRTASPASVTSFMVYDHGGSGNPYSANCDGKLEMTPPVGYAFHLDGTITNDATNGDFVSVIFDNGTRQRRFRSDTAGEPKDFTFDYDQKIVLHFKSNSENQYAGLNLTVSLIGISHAVTVSNANPGGGSITASVGGENVTAATANQTVTLTASPAEGYMLCALSVKDADGNIVDLTGDMLWYADASTVSFTMPSSDVTVTPVFTNVMTADGGLTVNMPKEWSKLVTIPSGVTSFKVYDYGGADANYLGENIQRLCLTAPAGCVLQLSGTVTTKAGGATTFSVYDGDDTTEQDYLVNHVYSATDGADVTIPAVVSSGEIIYFDFFDPDGDDFASLDLTVTVISPGEAYAVTVSNADAAKGTMTADVATATLGTTVTLTATPMEGCVLSDLILHM